MIDAQTTLREWKRNRTENERRYKTMAEHYPATCWACWTSTVQRPRGWNAPWLVHRAHVVNKPRLKDRRVVVLLCPACHMTSEGERLPDFQRPKLETKHLLGLIIELNQEGFDRDLLQACSVRILPEPENLPQWYLESRLANRGLALRLSQKSR